MTPRFRAMGSWVARTSALAATVLLISACGDPGPESGEVVLVASDGLEVVADWHRAEGPVRATIVAFHQGGGEVRGEYARIVPRLTAEGFQVLLADLRRGGDRFGFENRTAPPGSESLYSYCDAVLDVEAAVQEAWRFSDQVVLWGSSFSATLVINQAARDPAGVLGVLAFSPASGDPMEGCRPEASSADLDVPLLVLRGAHEMEFPSVREQMSVFDEQGHLTFVADPGRHGSSMLDSTRVEASTEHSWREVNAFLDGLTR
ncbi:MAG: alpha/beta hydrolase [Rhodothermales bacterium]|nr:alpha/beta hydrolase [Rhodothermales bacterium]MBO6781161.1 alpha/beta hydrolase [Rhodothermales bacterium]